MTHAVPQSPPSANPHYKVKRSVVIAQSADMRVIDITLGVYERLVRCSAAELPRSQT